MHKADVIETATSLLDNYGIADLTMRRLARELKVSPGALYWHFANKQQLLGAVADRILGTERSGWTANGWREQIEAVCTQLRFSLLAYTDGAELVSASYAAGESSAMDETLNVLTEAARVAGADSEQAGLAARTVLYFVLGFTADEQSRLQWDAAGARLPNHASVLSTDSGRGFAFGLRLLTDGIAAHAAILR